MQQEKEREINWHEKNMFNRCNEIKRGGEIEWEVIAAERQWWRDEETTSYWETNKERWGGKRGNWWGDGKTNGKQRGSEGERMDGWEDEGWGLPEALDRKCVSINISVSGSCWSYTSHRRHTTQYRSHVPWWMRHRHQCRPTQRSPPTGTNHPATALLNAKANTNGLMEPSMSPDRLHALQKDFGRLILGIYLQGSGCFFW